MNLLPNPRHREAVVASVSKSHARSCNHAPLAHGEASDDSHGEDRERNRLRHALDEVGGEGLTKVAVEDARDVDDSVGDDELEGPAGGAADGGGEEDGAGGGDVGVAALLSEMEGGVVAGHRPDDADEGHQDCHAVGVVGAVVYVAPDLAGRVEAREAASCTVAGCRDEDDDDEESDDVECAAGAVHARNPLGWEGRHDAVNHHDEDRQEEGLVVGWDVVGVLDATASENHGGCSIVDFEMG